MMKKLSVALLAYITVLGIGSFAFGFGVANVIITEIADPDDYKASYIELYNAGDVAQDLLDWKIEQYNSSKTTIFNTTANPDLTTNMTGNFSLGPGEYVILIRGTKSDLEATYGSYSGYYFVDGTEDAGVPTINGSEYFELYDSDSIVIDRCGNSSNTIAQDKLYQRINYPNDGTSLTSHWHSTGNPDINATPGSANDQSLPVTLSSFAAISTDSGVMLQWRTESEVDNLGWNIYRSEKKDGEFVKINDKLVPGAGNSAMPNSYQFADKTVVKGGQYYYYLEDVDIAGTRNKSLIIPVNKDVGKLTTTWSKIKKGQ